MKKRKRQQNSCIATSPKAHVVEVFTLSETSHSWGKCKAFLCLTRSPPTWWLIVGMDLFYSDFNPLVGDGIRRRVTVNEDVFNHSRALGVVRPLFDATQLTPVPPSHCPSHLSWMLKQELIPDVSVWAFHDNIGQLSSPIIIIIIIIPRLLCVCLWLSQENNISNVSLRAIITAEEDLEE